MYNYRYTIENFVTTSNVDGLSSPCCYWSSDLYDDRREFVDFITGETGWLCPDYNSTAHMNVRAVRTIK